MKVGVISDTHLSSGGLRRLSSRIVSGIRESFKELEDLVSPHFRDVDAVIHAGDLLDLEVITLLEKFGPVYAVAGNMDPSHVRQKLQDRQVVELAGFKIGITHGWGKPRGLVEAIRTEFDDVDCIVFGHSHRSRVYGHQGAVLGAGQTMQCADEEIEVAGVPSPPKKGV